MPTLQPQAALETAVVNAIIAEFSYPTMQCDRSPDGSPPASAGQLFIGVWSDGARTAEGRQSLKERFTVNITVTWRIVQPKDRWIKHRDGLETVINPIRALIAQDMWNNTIGRAANVLADYDNGGSRPVGFRESLKYLRLGPMEEKGPDWFSATPGSMTVGVAQTIYFGDCLHEQALPTAV